MHDLCLTEDSVDLGRMKGSQTANYQMSDVCTTTIPAELFQILVKQGELNSIEVDISLTNHGLRKAWWYNNINMKYMNMYLQVNISASDICHPRCFVFTGSEDSALSTCPSPLLGSFQYTYYDGAASCGSSSEWDGCTDTSRVSLNYTLCSRTVAYSGKHSTRQLHAV